MCSDGPTQLGSHRLRTATSGWPPASPSTQGPEDTKSCMTASPCSSQPPEYLHQGLVGKWPFFCPNSFHITVVFIQDTVSQRGCWDATSLVLQTARCGNITWWSKGDSPGLPSGDSETLRQLWAAKRDLCLLKEETFKRKSKISVNFWLLLLCSSAYFSCIFYELH